MAICMGFILKAEGEKTTYFTGDTVWIKNFEFEIEKYNPDYIIMNAALPKYDGVDGSSTIGEEDIVKCCKIYKHPKIVVTHLDCLIHCECTSKTIKKIEEENKIQNRVLIPNDGEIIFL